MFSVFFNPFFLEKNTSELFSLHHAISPFSELHKNNFLYLLWYSNPRVKKCIPSLFSQSVVGRFTPKWQCTRQTKPLPHKLCRLTSSLCGLHALLVQHLYSEFFQHMVWYGPTSETVWMQRRQKNG